MIPHDKNVSLSGIILCRPPYPFKQRFGGTHTLVFLFIDQHKLMILYDVALDLVIRYAVRTPLLCASCFNDHINIFGNIGA